VRGMERRPCFATGARRTRQKTEGSPAAEHRARLVYVAAVLHVAGLDEARVEVAQGVEQPPGARQGQTEAAGVLVDPLEDEREFPPGQPIGAVALDVVEKERELLPDLAGDARALQALQAPKVAVDPFARDGRGARL